MTTETNIKRFKEKVVAAVKELNADEADERVIFVFIANPKTGDNCSFGYGCPACAAETIAEMSSDGEFKHTGAEVKH